MLPVTRILERATSNQITGPAAGIFQVLSSFFRFRFLKGLSLLGKSRADTRERGARLERRRLLIDDSAAEGEVDDGRSPLELVAGGCRTRLVPCWSPARRWAGRLDSEFEGPRRLAALCSGSVCAAPSASKLARRLSCGGCCTN